jgi:hypothetical protein
VIISNRTAVSRLSYGIYETGTMRPPMKTVALFVRLRPVPGFLDPGVGFGAVRTRGDF